MTQEIQIEEFEENIIPIFDEDVSESIQPIQNFISTEPIPESKFRDLRKLKINYHQDRNFARSPLRLVNTLDTETDTNTGDIMLISDHTGRKLSLDEINIESLIQFLFSKRYQGKWNFFYNLNFDAEVIQKELGQELYRYRKTGKLNFEFNDYRIQYIPSKRLSILKGKKSTVFYDIAQYYKASLADAYQKNIGFLPADYLKMKSQRDHFTKRSYQRNIKLVEHYCKQDCIYTKQLAEHWIDLFSRACEFYPSRWTSSGYLAEKWLINSGIHIPKFAENLYEIQDIAWRSYYGGRFEMTKRGFIGESYLADINSAYPYAFANIPNIVKGKWKNLKYLDRTALLGFFYIECDIPDTEYIAPFPFRTQTNKIIFPTGKFRTWVTLAELQACPNQHWYRILDSWQYFDSNPYYPYKNFVESKYKLRLQLKKEKNPLELALKAMLNSIYGKTAQSSQGKGIAFGSIFNPIIASTITGTPRALLYAIVKKYHLDNYVISFATDSILSTKPIPIDSDILGSFKQEPFAYDTYSLQNGIGRRNGIWKNRGIGKLKGEEVIHENTVTENGNLYLILKKSRPNRLISSVRSYNIKDIGKFEQITRKVNLNADKKRVWINKIQSIDDRIMCDSIPIILGNPALKHLA